MKRTNLFLMAVAFLIAFSAAMSSCGKYEEGPNFSLASKKGRITNTWKLAEIYDDGVKEELDADEVEILDIKKDDAFTWTHTHDDHSDIEKGTWSFDSSKEHLVLTFDDGEKEEFKILRLTKNELWVVEEHGAHKHELRFVSAN
ncbi:MAG: lipocalin family protein [Cytophagaceae bacterium]